MSGLCRMRSAGSGLPLANIGGLEPPSRVVRGSCIISLPPKTPASASPARGMRDSLGSYRTSPYYLTQRRLQGTMAFEEKQRHTVRLTHRVRRRGQRHSITSLWIMFRGLIVHPSAQRHSCWLRGPKAGRSLRVVGFCPILSGWRLHVLISRPLPLRIVPQARIQDEPAGDVREYGNGC